MAAPHRETVTTEKMAAGGDALARLADGRVVFVGGALPGETVVIDVHTSKKDFARAAVVAVEQPSAARVAPPCAALARGCGGCGWQHATPEAQLAMKVDVVRDALRRTARLPDASVRAGAAVSPWGTRTTLRLAVAPDGRVGLRAAGSHRVVVLDDCPVAHPALAAVLPHLRVHGAQEVTVRVSAATGAVTALADRVGASIAGLPDGAEVGETATLVEHVAGHPLRVTAPSFFQSGPAAAALLVDAVRRAGGAELAAIGDGSWLDGYGGIGLFAATLGPPNAIVVESSPSACADARVNVPRAEVHCTPFERWAPSPVDVAVADPARSGLGKEAASVVAATGAAVVVLVSCDPVAGARDAALLAGHGYRHDGAEVLDLFPHTPHVEIVTRFTRPRPTRFTPN